MPMDIEFILNGSPIKITAEPDARTVDILRNDLGLTGVKEGCGAGECGACTVLIDGKARLSCLMLAAQLEGCRVTTIEGIADGDRLSALQESFISQGAVQCGFCTPGMILAATELLEKDPEPSRRRIREAISGNLCRCTGYQKIVDAIGHAASRPAEEEDA